MKLYKTTIIIWSEYDGDTVEIEDLAREATSGDAYCSRQISVLVDNPEQDPEWDHTEFFNDEVRKGPVGDERLGPIELPRSRKEIEDRIGLSFQIDATFYNKVNSIISIAGFKDKERIIARELLLYGEALTAEGLLISPGSFKARIIPITGDRCFYINDKLIDGNIKYFANYLSPYDLRGTSFFNPNTLKLHNDRSEYDIAAHLILIIKGS